MELISARIRARRKALGLTQKALGGRVGVSRLAVNAWEGEHSRPWEHLVELAAALDVSTDWLLTGHDPLKHAAGTPPATG